MYVCDVCEYVRFKEVLDFAMWDWHVMLRYCVIGGWKILFKLPLGGDVEVEYGVIPFTFHIGQFC